MSTPALNPLVEKIRAKYPGAYSDMDDATLTKAVLAKYPAYEDLARPNPATDASLQPHLPGAAGPLSRGLTAFGAAAGDLLNAGATMYGAGLGNGESGQIGTPSEPKPPSLGRDWESIKGTAAGMVGMATEPIERVASGDIAGGIGEGLANYPALLLNPKAKDIAAEKGTAGVRAVGEGMKAHPYVAGHAIGLATAEAAGLPWYLGIAGGPLLAKPVRAIGERLSSFRKPAEIPPPFADVGDFSKDVFNVKEPPLQGEYVQSSPVAPRSQAPVAPAEQVIPRLQAGVDLRLPGVGQTSVPRDMPYRVGPGGIPPEDVNAPNPRVLAGNQGIRTTPIAMLPERAGEDRLGSSAMMQHEGTPAVIPAAPPAPARLGRPDILDDQAMQEVMGADLESHGAQARREMSLERRARNDVSIPKWRMAAEAKARQIIDDAQKKAEDRAISRELGRGQPKIAKPKPSGPPAVKIKGAEEDLTPLLEKSLEQAKKKKGGK